MECVICTENYNKCKRLPRTLSCGHTFCSLCIIQVMKHGPLKCPYCRSCHIGSVLCPADLSLHEAMVGRLTEAGQADSPTQGDGGGGEEVAQLNVLELRETISSASTSGTIWACLTSEHDDPRHAEISLMNNRLHLHALNDGQPPSNSQTIPYECVQELVDEDAAIIFFEVRWGGCVRGRVYVVLLDDEGRTRQFRALCTGECGPSYAGTRFLEVERMHGAEQVWGGDYENNNGSGGAALPGMERGRKTNQSVMAGLVAGYYFNGYGQDRNPSQFGIYVKDMPGYVEMSSIGRVVGGLDIIASVANLDNVQEAYVSACGLLLSH